MKPGRTYTLCEVGLHTGWDANWTLDGAIVTPTIEPHGDHIDRCFDFNVTVGHTAAFEIDNITPDANITIKKYTNGDDAYAAPGPSVNTGDTVTWTYVVTNTGDANLSNIIVSDNRLQAGDITCPDTILAIDANMTCTATGTAITGQYENNGTVIATTPTGATVTDSDLSYYFATDVNGRIGDFAWYDDNDNGFQDSGEVPVNSLDVALLDASGITMATTTTNSNGYYLFDNLRPGTYSVEFSGLTSEYVFSTKQNDSVANPDGSTDPIILASGDDNLTIDVGLYCITPKDSGGNGGGCTYNPNSKSFDMMYILMLLSILFFGRRELKRNER